ncbi:MAG: hypothetical protein M1821_009296 [Bathelium mastoideum]|nr:MAG: hypothetical protein M1821_009296 [Bathelium mastoideum]
MSEISEHDILRAVDELCYADRQDLSAREQQILDLYSEQEEIRLEQALLNARTGLSDTIQNSNGLQEQLQIAEREVLEARASYMLRNRVIQDVLITDPILKAVHAGSHATLTERNLLPLVNARDVLSMLQSQLAATLNETHTKISEAKCANMLAVEKNRELTQELMDVVQQTKPRTIDEFQSPEARAQLMHLEREIKPLRQKWRVLKGLLAGTIVGSGVDWARDPALQALVLDNEVEMT